MVACVEDPATDVALRPAPRERIGAWLVATAFLPMALVILWPRPALWLDEAQSVGIARRSPAGIVDGLRADGAPPLYYALLHVWMSIFGVGDYAVRSMSVLAAAAAVAVLAVVGRRLFGTAAGVAAALLLGS